VTVGHAKVQGQTVAVRITCANAPCNLTIKLTAQGKHHRTVGVGSTSVTLAAGQTETVRIGLNQAGRHLLATRHALRVTLRAIQSLNGGHTSTVSTQAVIIKIHTHKHH